MGVHVNEVHTDIVPAGRQHHGPAGKHPKPSSASHWLEIRWLAERCSLRVRAECFSD
ncbi:MAG: hypothetical protein JWR34_4857 [Mycobacterium sp.]|jgi:hypothetical protein|nr:hypothetical protein [Mycobacterium sp.]